METAVVLLSLWVDLCGITRGGGRCDLLTQSESLAGRWLSSFRFIQLPKIFVFMNKRIKTQPSSRLLTGQ